jgi:hypothetical protein
MTARDRATEVTNLEDAIAELEVEDLRRIVGAAADRHDDVARAVRLAAARGTRDLAQLKAEIDRGLRSRRFLGYRESSAWATGARPIVQEIRDAVASGSTAELVALVERAIGHVVRVILKADDSDGMIGDLARDLLDIHATACDAGVADPIKLARWMIRFTFDDQDFFVPDPLRYASALGDLGLAAYRRDVRQCLDTGDTSFAVRYAQERLAVVDGDVGAIVQLLGGDQTAPHQFIQVAEAMAELGRYDDVLAWSSRGIDQTSGWQIAQLYDLAAGVYERRGDLDALLDLRRNQHERMASSTTYHLLRDAAGASESWESERDAARKALAGRDVGGLVDMLLADGEPDAAWQAAIDRPETDFGEQRWMRLAGAREPSHPADAVAVYLRLADTELETTGRAAYTRAARILSRAERAAARAERQDAFIDHMRRLRDHHRRRPTLIAILDKRGLP